MWAMGATRATGAMGAMGITGAMEATGATAAATSLRGLHRLRGLRRLLELQKVAMDTLEIAKIKILRFLFLFTSFIAQNFEKSKMALQAKEQC